MKSAEETGLAPAILLDVNMQALKIIRSLGRRGIPVIGVVSVSGRWEQSSRYCSIRKTALLKACNSQLVDYLVRLAGEFDEKPVLIPMQDDTVLFVSKFRDELQEHFCFLMPDPDILEALVSKSGLETLAGQYDVPQPKSYAPGSLGELEELAGGIVYPAVIKPAFSTSWQNREAQKVVNGKVCLVQSREELLGAYPRLAEFDERLVIQEVIPGPDRNLIYYVGYFDQDSQPVASFVGVKERVAPVHFGSASFVSSRYDANLIRLCIRFMEQIGYRGHVGIEFKYDDRDGQYKLIEVNARFGLWDGMAGLCDIDFPYINYEISRGHDVVAPGTFDDGVKWICFVRDLYAYRSYRRENALGTFDWLRSLSAGKRDYAVFALDDPRPFIGSTAEFLARHLRVRKTRG